MGTIRELSEQIVNGLASKGAKFSPILMAQVTDMISGIIEEWVTARELEQVDLDIENERRQVDMEIVASNQRVGDYYQRHQEEPWVDYD